jgi:hypothetical protein
MINAFSPDYVKTHMPEFLLTIRKESEATANGVKFGSMARATRESDGSKPRELSQFPKTKRVCLEPKQFNTYSKAGAK